MERKLRRSRDNRVLAGVCGGLGNFMGIDPVVIRIAVVLLMFFAGMSLWVYIIMWLLIWYIATKFDYDIRKLFKGFDFIFYFTFGISVIDNYVII